CETQGELKKIEKAVKLIAKAAPKPLGRAIKTGFKAGAFVGIQYIRSKIGLS
ncbi:MAG: hypothetical protein F6K62_25755, partial [Sphaerospermopsis sp. SIO1G2]|nr:hypothetical protein [Sphaerospermopsis sp. SIO1G2]